VGYARGVTFPSLLDDVHALARQIYADAHVIEMSFPSVRRDGLIVPAHHRGKLATLTFVSPARLHTGLLGDDGNVLVSQRLPGELTVDVFADRIEIRRGYISVHSSAGIEGLASLADRGTEFFVPHCDLEEIMGVVQDSGWMRDEADATTVMRFPKIKRGQTFWATTFGGRSHLVECAHRHVDPVWAPPVTRAEKSHAQAALRLSLTDTDKMVRLHDFSTRYYYDIDADALPAVDAAWRARFDQEGGLVFFSEGPGSSSLGHVPWLDDSFPIAMQIVHRLAPRVALHRLIARGMGEEGVFQTHGYDHKIEYGYVFTFVDLDADASEAVYRDGKDTSVVARRCLIDVVFTHDAVLVRPRYSTSCDDIHDGQEPRFCYGHPLDDSPLDLEDGMTFDSLYAFNKGAWVWSMRLRHFEGGGYTTPSGVLNGECP